MNTSGRRIVTLLFRRVGDTLLATPALRAIKKAYPDAMLEVLAEPQVERVFLYNPWVDKLTIAREVTAIQLARQLRSTGRPNAVVDFLSDPRSAIACFLSRSPARVGFAQTFRRRFYTRCVAQQNPRNPVYSAQHKLGLAYAIGARGDDDRTDFFLAEADREWGKQEWESRGWTDDTPSVAFFVHSRRIHKRWPLERFVKVIQHVDRELGWRPIILNTPGDDESAAALRNGGFVGPDSLLTIHDLGQLGDALSKCALLVGNDGGPKHLAVALNVPTLTIFGSDRPEYWTPPHSDLHHVVAPSGGGSIQQVDADSAIHMLDNMAAALK
jgi:ADP-heptose:LPS heptosyltransferase